MYAYGMKGAPAVGGGLPGLPRRRESVASGRYQIGDIHVSEHPDRGAWIEANGGMWDDRLNGHGYYPQWQGRIYEIPPFLDLSGFSGSGAHGWDLRFTADGEFAVASGSASESSNIRVFRASDGTAYTPIEVVGRPTGFVYSVSIDSTGSYLIATGNVSPYIFFFKRVGDVYERLPDPAHLPSSSQVFDCTFSPDGTHAVFVTSSSEGPTIYKREGDAFTVLPVSPKVSGNSRRCIYSPDGRYLLVLRHFTSGSGTALFFYEREGDTYTLVPDLVDIDPNVGTNEVRFSPDGAVLFSFRQSSAPYVYDWNGSMFLRRPIQSFPALGTGGTVERVSVGPLGKTVAMTIMFSSESISRIYCDVDGVFVPAREQPSFSSPSRVCAFVPKYFNRLVFVAGGDSKFYSGAVPEISPTIPPAVSRIKVG